MAVKYDKKMMNLVAIACIKNSYSILFTEEYKIMTNYFFLFSINPIFGHVYRLKNALKLAVNIFVN